MSVSQVDHSALRRLSGHSVFLYNKYGTNRVGSSIAPSQSSDSTLLPTRRFAETCADSRSRIPTTALLEGGIDAAKLRSLQAGLTNQCSCSTSN